MATVGVVGLGTMGSRLAGRLIDGGYEVHETDRDASRVQAIIQRGLCWHDTPRELAAAVDVAISMVTDDAALEAVSGGPDGVVGRLSDGRVYVDMTSVSPHASISVAQWVRVAGARMLDAPGVRQRSASRAGNADDHGWRR